MRLYTYIRNHRDFWYYSFGLDSKNYESLLSPGLQEGVFRIILLLSLCPEHWYDAQLLELPSYIACKLFSFPSSYFSKSRNKSLTSVTKTPCGGFCPPYGHKDSQLHTLSNTSIWAETPSFWKCCKTNLSQNAGRRFPLEQQTESCFHLTDHIISCINTSSITALSPGVACPLYTDWKWVKDTLKNYNSNQCLSQKSRVLLHIDVIWHSKLQSIYKQINEIPKCVADFHALAQIGHEQRVNF